MKHFFITVSILVVTIFIAIFTFKNNLLYVEPENICVTVEFKNETKEYNLEPFSTLDVILEKYQDETIHLEKLNPNQILHHKDYIILPIKEDIKCISLNTGTKEELITIKGIGPKTADSIIEYRIHQRFNVLEDILNVKGIGTAKFEKMKDYLCL